MNTGGVLLVDKPMGPTSHDVVAQIRRKLHTRQVGHAGTLDPAASGLLLVCVNEATRILEYLTATDKSYTGDIVFGIATDTEDATGRVLATAPAVDLTDERVQSALPAFIGTTSQTVPAYSAVHIDGVRAYELARAGKSVEMPSRDVCISSLSVGPLRRDGDVASATFEVSCSKGTYIRALCRDIGAAVGVPAHMGTLRRTAIGQAKLDLAVSLDDLMESDHPTQYLLPMLPFLQAYPTMSVSRSTLERLANGQRIPAQCQADEPLATGDMVFVVYDGAMVAVAQLIGEGPHLELQPKKVFWKRE